MIVLGHAVKTLESKETRASKKTTVTHNSVFAAQSTAMPDDESQDRHPAFCFLLKESGKEDLIFSQLSTINYKLSARGHSSVGRAPALQAGSQGFESPCLQIISDLANQ